MQTKKAHTLSLSFLCKLWSIEEQCHVIITIPVCVSFSLWLARWVSAARAGFQTSSSSRSLGRFCGLVVILLVCELVEHSRHALTATSKCVSHLNVLAASAS